MARKNPVRRKKRRTSYPLAGVSPGTFRPDPLAVQSAVQVFAYGPEECKELQPQHLADVQPLLGAYPAVWVNIDGLADLELIEQLEQVFGLHRLTVDDIVNVGQRVKIEEYENGYYIVVHMSDKDNPLRTEQISLFLAAGLVITVQERPGDRFDPIRERLRANRGRLRKMGADYLLYALLDTIIDSHFPMLEAFDEQLEALEDEIIAHPARDISGRIHQVKSDLLAQKKSMWPLKDVLTELLHDDSPLIGEATQVFFRDCFDHTMRIIESLESHREKATGLMDLYISTVSNNMNEIMKVLTIIATIFIPLSFIAGLYGMNFNPQASRWNMPELNWAFGYPFALALMSLVAGGLLVYFRWKGWLGGREKKSAKDFSDKNE